MLIFEEFNEEKYKNLFREEGRNEGLKIGREEGLAEGKKANQIEVATDLLKEGGMSVSFISRISKLSEDTVRKLANSLGIAVL